MKKSFRIALHAGYWFIYLLLIFCFLILIPGVTYHRSLTRLFLVVFSLPVFVNFILSAVIAFYVSYFLLFDRFLSKKRFLLLFITGLAAAIGTAMMSVGITVVLLPSSRTPMYEKFMMVVVVALLGAVHGATGLVMRGFMTWYDDLKRKQELDLRHFETELALVKSQINPHFLFNTINNIDVMITMDAERASLFLNKLSSIMRFMLYETRDQKIPLQKELDYINDYVELQKVRTSRPESFIFSVEGDPGGLQIAPMLFIPFIENAFTYSQNCVIPSVRISFAITATALVFTCENNYVAADKSIGGLGKELINRRLALIYPGKHDLQENRDTQTYGVTLKISLS